MAYSLKRHSRNILNASTQLLGAILNYTYNANESTSGASNRMAKWNLTARKAERWIDKVFFWQKRHCYKAALHEIKDCYLLLELHGVDMSKVILPKAVVPLVEKARRDPSFVGQAVPNQRVG